MPGDREARALKRLDRLWKRAARAVGGEHLTGAHLRVVHELVEDEPLPAAARANALDRLRTVSELVATRLRWRREDAARDGCLHF